MNSFSAGPNRVVHFLPICATTLFLWLALAQPALGQAPPALVSITPADGATGVGSTDPLVLVFDQPMDTSMNLIPSSPGFTGNFETEPANLASQMYGEWGDDERTLTIRPVLTVPLNITIVWRLNPPGVFSFLELKSQAGVALPTVSGSYSTGVGAPALGLTTPANGAVNVATNTSVVFRFTQPMVKETALSGSPPAVPGAVMWTGNGIDVTKISYTWSADGRQLWCDYAGGWPLSAVVGWALNPSAALVKLQSESGQLLAADTYLGTFTTAATAPCDENPLPANWGSYVLTKRSNYEQTSAADPVEEGGIQPAVFAVSVTSPSPGAPVTAGSVTLPGGTEYALTNLFLYQYVEILPDEAALDEAYPGGEYTIRFTQSGQAEQLIPMTMPTEHPPVPKILEFAAAQAVDAAADFTLRWTPWTGATEDDRVSIYIASNDGDVLFQAPDSCAGRELPATAGSIVVPANTLQAGRTYSAEVLFAHYFYYSTNDVPEMWGAGVTLRATHFTVVTTGGGGGPAAADLSAAVWVSSAHPQFSVQGTPLTTYTVERATAVPEGEWLEAGTVVLDATGHGVFEDLLPPASTTLFYRVVGH